MGPIMLGKLFDTDGRAARPERISGPEELDEILAASSERPVWLFKHSVTCPVSAMAWRRYKRFVKEHGTTGEARFTYLEVQHARPLSDAVAERTGVPHESPQALLLEGSRVLWHASHGAITVRALEAARTG